MALQRPLLTSQDALLGKTFIILSFKAHTSTPNFEDEGLRAYLQRLNSTVCFPLSVCSLLSSNSSPFSHKRHA